MDAFAALEGSVKEKSAANQQGADESPDSSHSGVSSDPTAVPTPESQSQALDEKEAIRPANRDHTAAKTVYGLNDGVGHTNTAPDEKAALKQAAADDEKAALKKAATDDEKAMEVNGMARQRTVQYSESVKDGTTNNTNNSSGNPAGETAAAPSTTGHQTSSNSNNANRGRRRAGTKSSARPQMEDLLSKEEAEELLKLVQGHLVQWPYDW